jgi:hypothetical protein
MSMTKKEQAEVEALKIRLALRFTEDVKPDIPKPESGIVNGYSFNSFSKRVEKSCSSPIGHNCGRWDKTDAQYHIAQYSSPMLAFRAMRREVEECFARELREIDRKIEALESEITP